LAVAVTEFIPPLGRIVHFSASGGGVDLIPQQSSDHATAMQLRTLAYEVLQRMADLPCESFSTENFGRMWRLCWEQRVGGVLASQGPPAGANDGTAALHAEGQRVGASDYVGMGEGGRAARFPYPVLRGAWVAWVRAVRVDYNMYAAADFEGVILASILGRDLLLYQGHQDVVGYRDRVVDRKTGRSSRVNVLSPPTRKVLDLKAVYHGFVADPARPEVTRDPNPLRIYYNGHNHFEALARPAWGQQYMYRG
jgi:hypothetical protein